jgi:hypothetical protein
MNLPDDTNQEFEVGIKVFIVIFIIVIAIALCL